MREFSGEDGGRTGLADGPCSLHGHQIAFRPVASSARTPHDLPHLVEGWTGYLTHLLAHLVNGTRGRLHLCARSTSSCHGSRSTAVQPGARRQEIHDAAVTMLP